MRIYICYYLYFPVKEKDTQRVVGETHTQASRVAVQWPFFLVELQAEGKLLWLWRSGT